MKNARDHIQRFIKFIQADIWLTPIMDLPIMKASLIKVLRIFVLAFRGFIRDKCALRASALTFFSLLCIVPLVAMLFGIAKGFGLQTLLEKEFMARFSENEQVMQYILDFSNSLLENAKGGLIAGIGIPLLFWAVIRLLGNIENALNAIWNIKISRSFIRKLSDYLTIMLIAPILLIISNGVTIFISVQVTAIAEQVKLLGFFGPVIEFLLKLMPLVLIWVLFAFLYIVMPNGKVSFKAGIFAAILAGTLFQFAQWILIAFQVGVAKYNAIYGSFAALPLFLIWLQVSWFVLLFGAEVSFAIQNAKTYEFDVGSQNISDFYKRLLSLMTTTIIVKHFIRGESALTAPDLSQLLRIPVRLVRQVLTELKESGILSQIIVDESKETAYQPALDTQQLTIAYVVDALDRNGTSVTPEKKSEAFGKLESSLESFQKLVQKSSANLLLKEL